MSDVIGSSRLCSQVATARRERKPLLCLLPALPNEPMPEPRYGRHEGTDHAGYKCITLLWLLES
jgi:hypothetical protein